MYMVISMVMVLGAYGCSCLWVLLLRYKHMDMADLEAQLQAADAAGAKVKLIATGETICYALPVYLECLFV